MKLQRRSIKNCNMILTDGIWSSRMLFWTNEVTSFLEMAVPRLQRVSLSWDIKSSVKASEFEETVWKKQRGLGFARESYKSFSECFSELNYYEL